MNEFIVFCSSSVLNKFRPPHHLSDNASNNHSRRLCQQSCWYNCRWSFLPSSTPLLFVSSKFFLTSRRDVTGSACAAAAIIAITILVTWWACRYKRRKREKDGTAYAM